MGRLLIFGLGYTASRLARRARRAGWIVRATRRTASSCAYAFDDPAIAGEIVQATHILSSVPPIGEVDPVLERHAPLLAASAAWVGYLSSTGVYGDTGGAWVDESAAIGGGRRSARAAADADWQALRRDVHVFRLPGIYGPGRSAIDRLRAGEARRIDAPDHPFSRIHVDDIVAALWTAINRPRPGIYNISDDHPAPHADVVAYASTLLGYPMPPLEPLASAALTAQARAFYSERRRVANGKMKRELGICLRYPDYRTGLRACLEESL